MEASNIYRTQHEVFILPDCSDTGGELFADSECPSDRFDEESRHGRCQAWVNTVICQDSLSLSHSIASSPKEEEKSASDYYSSDSDKSYGRKRRKPVRNTEAQTLVCEWMNCTYEETNIDRFHIHVSYHIPQLELRVKDDEEEVYGCLWAQCDFETENPQEVQRHVNHHAYHTRLKSVGSIVNKCWNLSSSRCGAETRNLLPDLLYPFLCDWLECGKLFNNVQNYRYHIEFHLNDYPTTFDSQRCKWRGCRSKFKSKSRLKAHLRTHTKDKVVACPNCGTMFASNSKYYDHCKRQIPIELSAYQCRHCLKLYPTKRLLREHMRAHINHYKCCFCDMTCSNPSMLSLHIRYKHLDAKPFVCDVCSFACKTQADLKNHMMKHNPDNQFMCDKDGCEYSCRSKRTLVRHMIDVHEVSESPVYCCHMSGCTRTFKRGTCLTKHLMERHYLSWPSGHSKFIYRREEDGCYRLQTLRYESLEVTQEAAKSQAKLKIEKATDFKITRKFEKESKLTDFVIEMVGEGETCKKEDIDDSVKMREDLMSFKKEGMEVLISIEDEQGNVLDCTMTQIENQQNQTLPMGAKLIAAVE